MNHSVFKDLVPSYIENLTSEETNRQMKEHMKQCKDCQEYFEEMKDDFLLELAQEQESDSQGVDYLKKVRLKNKKKIFVITGSLLALFIMAVAGYYFLFVHMWIADEQNVQKNIQQEEGVVTVNFQSKNDNRYLLTMEEYEDGEYGNTIIVYENWNILAESKLNQFSELASSVQNGTDISYKFLDEDHVVLPNGEETQLTDKDKLQIIYKNSTEEIPLRDLYDEGKND